MMRIATVLAPSTLRGAGLGLFTAEPVRAGEVIWRYDPGLDLLLDRLPEEPVLRAFVEKYGYEPKGETGRWLLCADNGRFINHSDAPNTRDTRDETVALVDMPAGTEITSDYRSLCENPFAGWPEGEAAGRKAA